MLFYFYQIPHLMSPRDTVPSTHIITTTFQPRLLNSLCKNHTYAFLTNSDFNFIAPKPSILQSIS